MTMNSRRHHLKKQITSIVLEMVEMPYPLLKYQQSLEAIDLKLK